MRSGLRDANQYLRMMLDFMMPQMGSTPVFYLEVLRVSSLTTFTDFRSIACVSVGGSDFQLNTGGSDITVPGATGFEASVDVGLLASLSVIPADGQEVLVSIIRPVVEE